VRVYAKHYVRQSPNNLTTQFNFNEREIIRPNVISSLIIHTFVVLIISKKSVSGTIGFVRIMTIFIIVIFSFSTFVY
jgi:hypothetical protein